MITYIKKSHGEVGFNIQPSGYTTVPYIHLCKEYIFYFDYKTQEHKAVARGKDFGVQPPNFFLNIKYHKYIINLF